MLFISKKYFKLGQAIDSTVTRFRYKDAIGEKTTYSRLANPIEWLEKAQLILRSFVMDLPMMNILSQDYGTFKGFYAENFVAQELRAQGRYPFFTWARNTSEVEFILSSHVYGAVFPLEVKSGFSQRSKSLGVYREKYTPNRAVKLSALPYRADSERAESKNLISLPLYLASYLSKM